MATKIFKDKVLTQTYEAADILSDTSIGTWQEDYPLTALDFERIKSGKPVTFIWANSIFLTTIGFGLNLVAKGISTWTNVPQAISIGEWAALGIGVVVSIVLYVVGCLLPNKRKTVMKNIETHFEEAPKRRQAYREAK
ncbi:MAG: hypothetical protein Q8P51_13665 [Ignavibacteria bacterium]|nr:hypothetical protein [Ignavibacteria bacterium]